MLAWSLLAAGVCRAQASAVTIVDLAVVGGNATVSGPGARVAALPGSAIKPLVLWVALSRGVIGAGERVPCRGSLRVANHNLACTHPRTMRVFAASEALAYSCNTYFAQVGRQMTQDSLQAGLQEFDLRAPKEADPNRRALVALGLAGEPVTPVALARAYARLAVHLHEASSVATTVRTGLQNSVRYGMARAAATPGWLVLGKTGTVDDLRAPYQHGWFAAIVSRSGAPNTAEHIIVVYAPGGSGNEAAAAAHTYLAGLAR